MSGGETFVVSGVDGAAKFDIKTGYLQRVGEQRVELQFMRYGARGKGDVCCC